MSFYRCCRSAHADRKQDRVADALIERLPYLDLLGHDFVGEFVNELVQLLDIECRILFGLSLRFSLFDDAPKVTYEIGIFEPPRDAASRGRGQAAE